MRKITTITLTIALFASGLIGCTAGQQAIEVGNPPTAESTMPEAAAHLTGISFSIPAAHIVEHQDEESLIISGPALLLTADAFEPGKEVNGFIDETSETADIIVLELSSTISCDQSDDGHLIVGECRGKSFVVQYRIEYDESLDLEDLPVVEIGLFAEYDDSGDAVAIDDGEETTSKKALSQISVGNNPFDSVIFEVGSAPSNLPDIERAEMVRVEEPVGTVVIEE